jgi:hypothetical protein
MQVKPMYATFELLKKEKTEIVKFTFYMAEVQIPYLLTRSFAGTWRQFSTPPPL